ncbi:MAG: Gfo/Idh/MocA family oxidoreductase [Legionellaceae bacterium]|nr:Gfo/Idh/MocA family oxidoreductase [Legionellaceae bacterium]
MKALLIGCGQMGMTHLINLFNHDLIMHVTVVDRNSEVDANIINLPQRKDYSFYQELDSAIRDLDLDNLGLCVIASNTACHKEHLLALISQFNGLKTPPLIFVEKPLVEDLQALEEIKPLLDNYPGHLLGGYLIRHSPASIHAANYLFEHTLKINSVTINWTKNRAPTRPSPGVLVDETTHGLDLVLNDLIKHTGFSVSENNIDVLSVKGALSNKVVDIQKQKALYGTLTPQVLADLRFRLRVHASLSGGEEEHEILVTGRSSFNAEVFGRSIELVCSDNTIIRCVFDDDSQDKLVILKNNEDIYRESFRMNKVQAELYEAIAYQLTANPTQKSSAAGLEDMVKSINYVEMIKQKIQAMLPFMSKDDTFSPCFKYKKTFSAEESNGASSGLVL